LLSKIYRLPALANVMRRLQSTANSSGRTSCIEDLFALPYLGGIAESPLEAIKRLLPPSLWTFDCGLAEPKKIIVELVRMRNNIRAMAFIRHRARRINAHPPLA
jgi:hypothetical protein